ncbi:Hypothetical_protein [Hexamita inflata]|uniref:Hypothetical_protein n=1 Tax=Hexamita inflata TaxID=28002 RepID=A0AA86NKK9_9EUKA|nr:Hypothetical protein HINF_LOCUS9477 [Hexamita inflata]
MSAGIVRFSTFTAKQTCRQKNHLQQQEESKHYFWLPDINHKRCFSIYYITSLRRGSHFRLQVVGQLAYKGVGHVVTPLQASDKNHAFQLRFFDYKPFIFDIIFGYILDTFHLQGG